METKEKVFITVQAVINAPIEKVWKIWTDPEDIIKWNNASADWHTTKAENDLRAGGKFVYRMEAKDGSFGFDFGGTYTLVKIHERIENTLDDGRSMKVLFSTENNQTKVVETFEAENENSVELQQMGWQSILDNFRKYTESV